jgi:soluble lytic murein transglycosylase-like protein
MKYESLLLFAGAVSGLAQAPADLEKAVRAAMAPALAQQRASVQKQAASAIRSQPSRAGSSFFTLPIALHPSAAADCEPLPDEQLDPLIETAAEKTDLDPQLVRAVIEEESAGRPCAVSVSGAEGLMQLMPATAEQFDVRDPFDPRQNVEAGTKLLKLLLNRYDNDASLALSAYNAGPSRVDQEGGIPAIPETLQYVTDILTKLGLSGAKATPNKPQDEPETSTR